MFPETKSELTDCILSSKCKTAKNGLYTHSYICQDWFLLNGTIAKINCLLSLGQEPYVLVRHSAETPMFNPHLYNYGYNKQVFFEELRFWSRC